MVLGYKRIAVLALIAIAVFKLITYFTKEKTTYIICLVFGSLGVICCYGFIAILSMGNTFYEFVDKFGINTMGRIYYYKAIMDLTQFSPSFTGFGRNSVTAILRDSHSYLGIGQVHSDIIKMYAECGFILFGVWLVYYLVFISKKYKERFGYKYALMYFAATIYIFVLYLTDNVEIYFICQIFYIMVPVTYALNCREKAPVLKQAQTNRNE